MTDPKDYLRQMIDHTIDGNPDAASDAFKSFLVPKTMQVLGTNSNVSAEVDAAAAEVDAAAAAEPAEVDAAAAAEPAAEPAAEAEPAAAPE